MGSPKEEESEGSYLCKLPREESLGMDSYTLDFEGIMDEGTESLMDTTELQPIPPSTLTGNLKQLCTTLYFTLSSSERHHLDTSVI
jgi:hypothetical protein